MCQERQAGEHEKTQPVFSRVVESALDSESQGVGGFWVELESVSYQH